MHILDFRKCVTDYLTALFVPGYTGTLSKAVRIWYEKLPDRYWLNQLYRAIIFSPLNMDNSSTEYDVVRNKIYGILNGEYEIEWTGDIFAFWLDENSDKTNEYEISSDIHVKLCSEGINVGSLVCHNCGQMYIQKMLLPEGDRGSHFVFNNIVVPTETDDEDGDNDSVENISTEVVGDGNTIPKTESIKIPFIQYLADEFDHSRVGNLFCQEKRKLHLLNCLRICRLEKYSG